MKIFVTIGTTSFPELIKKVDNIKGLNVIIQTPKEGKDEYIPKNYKFFEFCEDIEKYYNWADIIITHAGAGSVYKLLELGKKIIIIPNLSRVDTHQTDLADYIKEMQYALVCYDLNQLETFIQDTEQFVKKPYKRVSFNKGDAIIKYLVGK
jgi:beta-1,4-N-acetylglucosaminyltransferase